MKSYADQPNVPDLMTELARKTVELRQAKQAAAEWKLAFLIAIGFLIIAVLAHPVGMWIDSFGV